MTVLPPVWEIILKLQLLMVTFETPESFLANVIAAAKHKLNLYASVLEVSPYIHNEQIKLKTDSPESP